MCTPYFLKNYSFSHLFDAVKLQLAFTNKLQIYYEYLWNASMSRGLKETSTVIVRSNPLTYGTTQGRMRMLGKASRGTKGGKMERISTEFPCLPGSRIYSLTSPGQNLWKWIGYLHSIDNFIFCMLFNINVNYIIIVNYNYIIVGV